ncbi:5-hydroxytryptamine receptor 4-like [Gigantopelta aegis]|uniref:5-hydroxytryptamine receptor 4-like n=1 Tax=Gigantopelta aegis TaxID=1735272 RepID=UPI001B887D3B|nr:5-hydroxytryptamine receptor 4-like [Gigantopelta aegis]
MDDIRIICGSIFQALAPVAPPTMSAMQINAFCTFMLIITLAAATGNILVIIVIAKFRTLRKQSNAHIASLALADVLVAVIVIPLRMYENWNDSWNLPKWTCYLRNFFDGGLIGVSILSLCALAADRYLSVCHPLTLMKVTRPVVVAATIAFCWVTPFLVWTVLLATGWHMTGLEIFEFCLMLTEVCVYVRNTANVCSTTVLSFVLPSFLIIFVYSKIFSTARRHARAVQDSNSTHEDAQKNSTFLRSTKAAVAPGIVVAVFFVCWLPYYLALISDVINEHQLVPKLILQVLIWLGYLNSMMNPILYYIFSQDFKFAFKSLFRCNTSEMVMLEVR